jgi:hypothetical protein
MLILVCRRKDELLWLLAITWTDYIVTLAIH